MNSSAVLEYAIVDISRREICFIPDMGDIKYVTWEDTETFMYIWELLQTIIDYVNVDYVFCTAPKPQ